MIKNFISYFFANQNDLFIGNIYTLLGFEQDKKLKLTARSYLNADINKRIEYVKTRMLSGKFNILTLF